MDKQLIRVGHSPDPDDAFMFYALAKEAIDTGPYRFTHELVDIETLNRRAFTGELELTAVSLHAYAHLADKYVLCSCGASMGDQYGPMVVARRAMDVSQLKDLTIAVPGTLTTAYLALSMCIGDGFRHVVVPFDQILDVVVAGEFEGRPIDAGLIIHEGQLTYSSDNLQLIVDLGKWWYGETELPLPLGANALRKDLGPAVMADVHRLLKESIQYGLDHRDAALDYALAFGARPGPRHGGRICRHVRQRLDVGLRAPRPPGGRATARPRTCRRRDSAIGPAGVHLVNADRRSYNSRAQCIFENAVSLPPLFGSPACRPLPSQPIRPPPTEPRFGTIPAAAFGIPAVAACRNITPHPTIVEHSGQKRSVSEQTADVCAATRAEIDADELMSAEPAAPCGTCCP